MICYESVSIINQRVGESINGLLINHSVEVPLPGLETTDQFTCCVYGSAHLRFERGLQVRVSERVAAGVHHVLDPGLVRVVGEVKVVVLFRARLWWGVCLLDVRVQRWAGVGCPWKSDRELPQLISQLRRDITVLELREPHIHLPHPLHLSPKPQLPQHPQFLHYPIPTWL